MSIYSIIDNQTIEPHIKFLRINPTDLKVTLKSILDSLMNLSWLNSFDEEFLKSSYEERSKSTIEYISSKIIKEEDDSVTSSSGEYIVSELARSSVVETYSYLDVPLAELFKKKVIGNPGFDFYSSNLTKNILFGEAKYLTKQNAYGNALKQVSAFYNEKQHITDLADIQDFFCKDSLNNCNNNDIGFMIAFSAKKIDTKKLIEGITKNTHYATLKGFKEIILIGVNI